MFDAKSIQKDFPLIVQSQQDGFVYLDNAATTQKPQIVLHTLLEQYTRYNGNVHRGAHRLSQQSTARYEQARQSVQRFLHASHPEEIVFTRGTTESINLVASSLGQFLFQEGDAIVVTAMEHHSNFVPWQMLCQKLHLSLYIVPFDANGELCLDQYQTFLSMPKVKLAAFCQVSNVFGTCNPVEAMTAAAHARGIPVLIDGAQAAAHMPVDVQQIGCDFYCFSAHKTYGPNGIGVLYAKKHWLEQMPPYQYGGEMVDQVTCETTSFADVPLKFEAGTPDYPAAIAFASALAYLEGLGLHSIQTHEKQLLLYARQQLSAIPNVHIFGNPAHAIGCLSFCVSGIHPYDLALVLDQFNIAIRTGSHCAQLAMRLLQVDGTARISFACYNTTDDVDVFCDRLRQAIAFFQGGNGGAL